MEPLLVEFIKQRLRMNLFAGLALLAGALLFLVVILLLDPPIFAALLLGLVVLGVGAAATWLLGGVLQHWSNPQDVPVLKIIREQARSIVWIYGEQQRGKLSKVVLGTADGKRYSIPVSPEHGYDIRIFLEEMVPAAARGFSVAAEKRFKSNPKSLLGGGQMVLEPSSAG